jgi:hypothetical protein
LVIVSSISSNEISSSINVESCCINWYDSLLKPNNWHEIEQMPFAIMESKQWKLIVYFNSLFFYNNSNW